MNVRFRRGQRKEGAGDRVRKRKLGRIKNKKKRKQGDERKKRRTSTGETPEDETGRDKKYKNI